MLSLGVIGLLVSFFLDFELFLLLLMVENVNGWLFFIDFLFRWGFLFLLGLLVFCICRILLRNFNLKNYKMI